MTSMNFPTTVSKKNHENTECAEMCTDKSNSSKLTKSQDNGSGFQCNVCGNRFASKANLVCHLRIHTGEMPCACDVCGKNFAHSSNLARHKRLLFSPLTVLLITGN